MANIVENTGVYQGTEVRSWLVANAKLRVGMDRWSWEYVAYDIQDGHIGFYLNSDPAKRRHEVWGSDGEYLGVREALSSLHAQAEAMNRLRAALPELEGVEGIEVHTMDSLLNKLCGPRLESEGQDVIVDRAAEVFGGLSGDWTDEDAEVVLNCAGLSSVDGEDAVDQMVDLLAKVTAGKGHKGDALLVLARVLMHHIAEAQGVEPERLNWVMGTEGDGWVIVMPDGSEYRLVKTDGR